MASRIDTGNINTGFPVAGIDNDSQGFRDNFNEIKAALDDAALDIDALHEFVGVPTTAADTLVERVAALETSVDAIDVTGLAADVAAAESNVATLIADVTTLEDRIANVDQPLVFEVEQSSDTTSTSDSDIYSSNRLHTVTIELDYENGKYQVFNASGLNGHRQFSIINFGSETENRAAHMTIEVVQGSDDQRFSFSSVGVSFYIDTDIAYLYAGGGDVGVSGDRHIFEITSRDGGDTIYLTKYQRLSAGISPVFGGPLVTGGGGGGGAGL